MNNTTDGKTQGNSEQGQQDAPPAGGALGRLGSTLQRLSSAREGGRYQGALSYAAEWHALTIGVGVGLSGSASLQTATVAYALGRGGRGALGESSQAKDVTEEPAYALAGIAAGRAVAAGRMAELLSSL